MFEVVEDAVLLHQAGDEVKVGLTILDAIFPLIIAGGKRLFVVRASPALKHCLDDLRDCLVLENAAISDAGKEPQPGYYLHLVVSTVWRRAALRKAADEAVNISLLPVGEGNSDGDVLAYDILKVNILFGRQQIQVKTEKPRYALMPGESLQQENVLPERGLNGNQPIFLCIGHTLIHR